jgi:hypothetical protein
MEQLRLGFPPREAANPLSRLLVGLGTVVVGLAAAALIIFVLLPLAGIIVSAALGGMLLALAGILMMVPLILVAATVLAIMARSSARKPRPYRSPPSWR